MKKNIFKRVDKIITYSVIGTALGTVIYKNKNTLKNVFKRKGKKIISLLGKIMIFSLRKIKILNKNIKKKFRNKKV